MDSLSPNLFVRNIQASIAFYERLGFHVTASFPVTGPSDWAMLTNGPVTIMLQTFASLGNELQPVSRNGGGSLLLYIQTQQIRQFFASIQASVNVLKGLEKTFYGATEFSIADPDGFVLTFAEDEQDATATG